MQFCICGNSLPDFPEPGTSADDGFCSEGCRQTGDLLDEVIKDVEVDPALQFQLDQLDLEGGLEECEECGNVVTDGECHECGHHQ